MCDSKKITMATTKTQEASCCICLQTGTELRVTPCQCSFHTKCFPVSYLANNSQKQRRGGPLRCPACGNDTKGVYIIPMDVNAHYYENSAPIGAPPSPSRGNSSNTMTPFLEELYLSLAPIFLFETGQSNYTNINIAEEVEIRNGRWTPEEIQFIECLINLFKEGNLPISTGVTLNNFLRSIFLCKSTRLRKKIKNANFCTSTFLLRTNEKQQMCASELSKLQERFLNSLEDKKSRNLLRLSMRRMWSTYFFNLCMHLGYDAIIAQDWLNSLEEVEEKINSAKESKKIRERRDRSSSYGARKYPGMDGLNHRHLNLNRSNHSHQQLYLDRSNHNYHRPLNLNVSNHSHRQLNLDSSNHSHNSNLPRRKSNLSFALDQAQQSPQVSLKRPCALGSDTSNQGMGLDGSNHSHGLNRMALNSYSHRPIMTPLPPRYHGSLPTDLSRTSHGRSPPKNLLSVNKSDSNGSFWGKGMSRQPEIVPLEIGDNREDTGNLSDVSDSESNVYSSSIGIDFVPVDTIRMQESRSSKRARVEDAVNNGQSGRNTDPFLDDVIEEVSTADLCNVAEDDLCDVADVCERFGDWSPFVAKMSNFVEKEDLPFDYFDVWMVSKKKDEDQCEETDNTHDLTKGSSSDLVLRHVGHSGRSDGSIWTLYHMNEFGKLSSNFSFPPGIGLPGRVLSSGLPLWDDSIPNSSQMKFPRVEGAKAHGIKNAVGIPLYHTPFGKVVVAMYSTQDIKKDMGLVQKCCQHFQGSQGVDKMGAFIFNVANSVKGSTSSKNFPCLLPDESDENCIDSDEQLVINLLAKHAPANGVTSSHFAASHTSLRLFLLGSSSKRTARQNEFISVLKKSYKNYMETNRPENDVATLLVHEWKFLNDMQPQTLPIHPQRRASLDVPEPRDTHYHEADSPITNLSPPVRERSSSIPLAHMNY